MTDRPLLCLLPGLLCDVTVWEPQIAALGPQVRTYVPDFWGMDSFEAMARKVLAETSGPLDVAGHSMGGRVALELWRLAPERVRRLALMDTGAHPSGPQEREPRMALVRLAYDEGMEAVAKAWLPPMLHPDRRNDRALVEPLTAMIRRATPEVFERQQKAGLERPDARGYLPRIACPTLVLVGRQDAWSPLARHEEMARAIPGSRLAVIEDCGHMCTVEQPEAVTEALRQWLAMTPSDSAAAA